MSLVENTLFGTVDKVAVAIERIRSFEPPEGYYLAFSGGKDSQVIYDLAQRAGVTFDAHYNLTTVDPPELVQFIRRYYPQVEWTRPRFTMWELIEKKYYPPTSKMRYCCEMLKEPGGHGRYKIIGIRWAESLRRKTERKMVEVCYKSGGMILSPIIDWSDEDVWQYHRQYIPHHCSLYDEGFKRIGCVMCAMMRASVRRAEAARWPKIADAYRRACRRAYARILARGKKRAELNWTSGDDMYEWWLRDERDRVPDEQEELFSMDN